MALPRLGNIHFFICSTLNLPQISSHSEKGSIIRLSPPSQKRESFLVIHAVSFISFLPLDHRSINLIERSERRSDRHSRDSGPGQYGIAVKRAKNGRKSDRGTGKGASARISRNIFGRPGSPAIREKPLPPDPFADLGRESGRACPS